MIESRDPLTAIEEAIVERLRARLPGRIARIDSYPDRPDSYDFPISDGAAVFVRYAGSDYAPTDGPRRAYSAAETSRWEIVLLVRGLRSDTSGRIGAYEALDEIRRALHGERIAGAAPAMPVRRQLDEEREGVWRWTSVFQITHPAIAEATVAPAPLLRGAI